MPSLALRCISIWHTSYTLVWFDISILLLPTLTIVHANRKRLMSTTTTAFVRTSTTAFVRISISLIDWIWSIHSRKDALKSAVPGQVCMCAWQRPCVDTWYWEPRTHAWLCLVSTLQQHAADDGASRYLYKLWTMMTSKPTSDGCIIEVSLMCD